MQKNIVNNNYMRNQTSITNNQFRLKYEHRIDKSKKIRADREQYYYNNIIINSDKKRVYGSVDCCKKGIEKDHSPF